MVPAVYLSVAVPAVRKQCSCLGDGRACSALIARTFSNPSRGGQQPLGPVLVFLCACACVLIMDIVSYWERKKPILQPSSIQRFHLSLSKLLHLLLQKSNVRKVAGKTCINKASPAGNLPVETKTLSKVKSHQKVKHKRKQDGPYSSAA